MKGCRKLPRDMEAMGELALWMVRRSLANPAQPSFLKQVGFTFIFNTLYVNRYMKAFYLLRFQVHNQVAVAQFKNLVYTK